MNILKFNVKNLISRLWVVLMINMLKADILSLFIPWSLDELAQFAGDTPIENIMFVAAIMMEILIVMIFLTQVLPYKWNKWLNILVPVFTILFVVWWGSSTPHYIFIAGIEVIIALLIIWLAFKLPKENSED